ncbi:hypothetical protein ACA910_004147 [Epithemia clementina (nom. ined.)]
MTIPKATDQNDMERFPVAQGLRVPNDEGDETSEAPDGLRARLISDLQQLPDTSERWDREQKSDSGKGFHLITTSEDYNMTTANSHQSSTTQAYWGRFNDATAQVLPAGENNGFISVVTARPDDRLIRLNFIRKVYAILSAQLLLTFVMCAWMALVPSMRTFCLETSGGITLLYTNMVLGFVLICFMHGFKRRYPHNYIILTLFTVSMSYMIGFVTATYEQAGAGDLVIEAVFITFTVFVVLTLFTLQSKWDFSFMGAGLGMLLWIMILWSIFSMIFGFQTGSVYALLGSILFSAFIIYDTYMIAERLDPEDYIVAAIELYLDIINLFLYILRLLGDNRR